jgi:hypothetical protein
MQPVASSKEVTQSKSAHGLAALNIAGPGDDRQLALAGSNLGHLGENRLRGEKRSQGGCPEKSCMRHASSPCDFDVARQAHGAACPSSGAVGRMRARQRGLRKYKILISIIGITDFKARPGS